jgi:hypothetical protein
MNDQDRNAMIQAHGRTTGDRLATEGGPPQDWGAADFITGK